LPDKRRDGRVSGLGIAQHHGATRGIADVGNCEIAIEGELYGSIYYVETGEARGSELQGGYLVWCDDEDQVEATIADMIERKEIKASDRICCVYWLRARRSAGDHERWLESLEEST